MSKTVIATVSVDATSTITEAAFAQAIEEIGSEKDLREAAEQQLREHILKGFEGPTLTSLNIQVKVVIA